MTSGLVQHFVGEVVEAVVTNLVLSAGQPPPPDSHVYGSYGNKTHQNVYSINAAQVWFSQAVCVRRHQLNSHRTEYGLNGFICWTRQTTGFFLMKLTFSTTEYCVFTSGVMLKREMMNFLWYTTYILI